ncbi:MAG: fumarylacetoacetate hydrolase family protein [bacterium]|nr:fumarylacetoacetate hydrolase family protein [bacterium]
MRHSCRKYHDAAEVVREESSLRLRDMIGFRKHVEQIRGRRGERFPDEWYERPYGYDAHLQKRKIKGNGDAIIFPSFVTKADYEFEICLYFPYPFETKDEREAIEFVTRDAFFTIFNDTSARDFQPSDMAMRLSVAPSKGIAEKSFGPWMVPASNFDFDENGVPYIHMRLFVKHWRDVSWDLRCEDNFRSIYFDDPKTGAKKCWSFAQVIAWYGRMNQGFEKGDLLASGTIGNGCIAEFAARIDSVTGQEIEPAKYPWLQEGDSIRMDAGALGVLENEVAFVTMPDPRRLNP